jgi:tRNA(Ile)-lysidine synthase
MPSKIAVAVSGGIDSTSLLFLLQDLKKISEFSHLEIYPITVDHKIRQNSSAQCQEIYQYLSKYFPLHQILTAQYQKTPQANVENIARKERYELLTNFCHQNKIKHLFLGITSKMLLKIFLLDCFVVAVLMA